MQVNEEEFTRKLMELSKSTMQKISSLATSKENLRKIHKIVMESKTEQEILTAIVVMQKQQEQEVQNNQLYPRTGIIVDGEVFPFSMTCEEYDEYLKYLEEKRKSKE